MINKPNDVSVPGRRIVTGVNNQGKSTVIGDGSVPETATWSLPEQGRGGDLWIEDSVPVDLTDSSDPMADYTLQDWPPAGGVIVRTGTWRPGSSHRSRDSRRRVAWRT